MSIMGLRVVCSNGKVALVDEICKADAIADAWSKYGECSVYSGEYTSQSFCDDCDVAKLYSRKRLNIKELMDIAGEQNNIVSIRHGAEKKIANLVLASDDEINSIVNSKGMDGRSENLYSRIERGEMSKWWARQDD